MCSYFFCNWGDPSKRSAASIVRTIVSQLARKSPPFLTKLTDLRETGYSLAQPLLLIWQELVIDNLDCIPQELCVVLDGLDECEQEERQSLIEIIISADRTRRISWLVFSRYLPDIAVSFEPSTITLEPGDTSEDMTAYIEQRVSKSRLLSNPQVRMLVTAALHKEARGIFLWVKLILQELEQQRTLTGVLAALRSLPLGMESLYTRILQTLDHVLRDERTRIASAIFGWIACAARPMSVDELTDAVQWSLPDIGELLDLKAIVQEDCGALVSVSTTSLVQFIHHTVHQYLCSERCSHTFAVDPAAMHEKIATVCLTYLSDNKLRAKLTSSRLQWAERVKITDRLPLLGYAVLYWVDHIIATNICSNLLEKLTSFLRSENLLVVIEAAVMIAGVGSINRWAVQLLKCNVFSRNDPRLIELQRFAADLQHVVRHYGHVLNERPDEIHNLINQCFPVNSFFWKYFGRNEIRFMSGQCEEWDPCIAVLDYIHVNCIAVSKNGYFTLADAAGVHVIDESTRIEMRKIAAYSSPVIAMAVDDATGTLAVLTANGSLRLLSTTTWEVVRELSQIVKLPPVVREWSWSRFWTLYFLHIDPLHVDLDLAEGTVYTGGSAIDVAEGRVTQSFPHRGMTNSVTQFASSMSGIVTGMSANGTVFQRSTVASRAQLKRKGSGRLHNNHDWRLLAASRSGKYIIACRTWLFSDYAVSEDRFKCLVVNEPARNWEGTFGSAYRISAAAISLDETLVAVSAHDRMNLLDAMKVWNINGEPSLVWESTIFDDHTTSLRFAIHGNLLIKAGRYVRVWDTELMRKSKSRKVFPLNLAVRLSHDGKHVASVPGEQVGVAHAKLVLQSTERESERLEIPWPNIFSRNIHLKEPISFSQDDQLIVWDQAVFSVRTGSLSGFVLLEEQEKVCQIGGFSYDSSMVVYGTDRRPPRLRRRDIPLEQLDSPPLSGTHGDRTQTIIAYRFETSERQPIFSASELSVICMHPSQLAIGFLAQEEQRFWKFYVYSLSTWQCLASAAIPDGTLINASVGAHFSEVSPDFFVALPHLAWREGRDFGGAWTDVCMTKLGSSTNPETQMSSEIVKIPHWHICHFLSSGKVLFFMQDGWIMLWDKEDGLQRVKYLPPQFQWSISAGCTSAIVLNGVIRVAIQSLAAGVFWFDVDMENLSECISFGPNSY